MEEQSIIDQALAIRNAAARAKGEAAVVLNAKMEALQNVADVALGVMSLAEFQEIYVASHIGQGALGALQDATYRATVEAALALLA